MEILHEDAKVCLFGHGVGLQVDETAPIKQRVKEKDEQKAKKHLCKKLDVVNLKGSTCTTEDFGENGQISFVIDKSIIKNKHKQGKSQNDKYDPKVQDHG